MHEGNSFANGAKVNTNKQTEQENATRSMNEYRNALTEDEVFNSANGAAINT